MELTAQFKERVRDEVLSRRKNYEGSDKNYANSLGIAPSSYSKFKNGEVDRVISNNELLRLGMELNVSVNSFAWKIARTEVYNNIESNLKHCQEFSQSMILVDEWGIGKTASAMHIIKSMRNAFYIDCSQCKTKRLFIKAIAKVIGVDSRGTYMDIKNKSKYYLNIMEKPLIVLDDAGDLDYAAFLELKEMLNGTEESCAWYLIGDDSLAEKINKGKENKKVGYGAIFSRFGEDYINIVPQPKEDKQSFYIKLLTDVANINVADKDKALNIVRKSMAQEGSLRYLKNLIKVNSK
jgi:transcriptional regulator with XRE-family HTH domain